MHSMTDGDLSPLFAARLRPLIRLVEWAMEGNPIAIGVLVALAVGLVVGVLLWSRANRTKTEEPADSAESTDSGN